MLVVDAGPLVAAAATRDRNHERCVALLSQAPRPLIVPVLVVTEVAYFLVPSGEPPAGGTTTLYALYRCEFKVVPDNRYIKTTSYVTNIHEQMTRRVSLDAVHNLRLSRSGRLVVANDAVLIY